jgi:hypothetical protein
LSLRSRAITTNRAEGLLIATEPQIQKLSKLDAAKRQLVEAIRLHFERRDAVAVHLLAASALQVISDIAGSRGVSGIIKNNPRVREDKRAEFDRLMNKAVNFMKHADRDADGVLEFRPEVTEFYILDAILVLQTLREQIPWACRVYAAWFGTKHPDLLNDEEIKALIARFRLDPREYDIVLEVIRRGAPSNLLTEAR